MSKVTKRNVSLIGCAIIFLLVMTWFFPFSFFSLNKSYTYQPHPGFVENYVENIKDFNAFKASSQFKTEIDLTAEKIEEIAPMFQREWLISKNGTKVDEQQLDTMLLDVRKVRQILLELMVQENYSKEVKEQLVSGIRSIFVLESSIIELQNNSLATRNKLNNQFANLHSGFISTFYVVGNFYEKSIDESDG